MLYCVSCAIHGRVVRVRNKVLRASPEGRIYKPPMGKGGGKGNWDDNRASRASGKDFVRTPKQKGSDSDRLFAASSSMPFDTSSS